jgi:hypothetical protein
MSFSRPIQWYHSHVDPKKKKKRTNKKADLRIFQRQSVALFVGVPWQECCQNLASFYEKGILNCEWAFL